MTHKRTIQVVLFSGILVPSSLLAAEIVLADTEDVIDLAKVVVVGKDAKEEVFTTNQVAADFSKNLVQDERDLLRKEVGIGITESGRAGSNGFAIRGVDKDRVAVIVDGLPQAETFMPSIYKGYGYFNGSVNNTEYENIGQMNITKGANSVSDGSGAIGGSVHFKTKGIEDFVLEDRELGGFLKSGYASKSREWRQVIGAGFRTDKLFGLAQMTKRWGHEIVNDGTGEDIYGSARSKPDPVKSRSTSWLGKIGYQLSPQQRITAFYESRQQYQDTEEKSFDSWGTHRFAADTAPYYRYGLEYEYLADDQSWLDTVNVVLAKQKINMKSETYNVKQSDHAIIEQEYSRQFDQRQNMIQAQLFTTPLMIGSQEHTFQGKIEYRHASLRNDNHDVVYLSDGAHPSSYSIMTPVKSRIAALSIQDQIEFSPQLNAIIGLRYDHYQYRPQLDGSNKFPTSFDAAKKTFSKPSWQLDLTYDLTSEHQVGYKISTGFRAPKIEEVYFEFGKGGANHFMPNVNLKPETALNQEISYQFNNEVAHFGIGAFHSRYRNFIDERVSEGRAKNPWYDPHNPWGGSEYFYVNQIQFVNVAKATISGIEFSGSLNGKAMGLSESWNFYAKGQYSKGKNQDGDPLKSIQPWSMLMGVDYEASSGRWNTSLSARYSAAKKGRDTKETLYSWRGKEEKEWPWLSHSYVVVDLTGQVKIDRDITLNMGVFNLFNRSYHTWDSLRDLPTYGTTNRIDRNGRGLGRFTAPKRNFALSIEARF